MQWVYIAVMVLGLVGMMVCSKKQKNNPAMQPVAFVLFVVVVIGAGMLLREWGVFGGGRDSLLQNELAFYASQGTKTGAFLKQTDPGKKILLVADPGFENNDNIKRLANALKDGYGGEVIMDTVQVPGMQEDAPMPLYMMMKAKEFDEMVDKHGDCDIVVSTIGLPQDARNLKFMGKKKLFLMGLPSGPVPGLQKALNDGNISGLIISNPQAKYDVSAPSDPMKAFDIRYVLVNKDNAEQFKAHFSN